MLITFSIFFFTSSMFRSKKHLNNNVLFTSAASAARRISKNYYYIHTKICLYTYVHFRPMLPCGPCIEHYFICMIIIYYHRTRVIIISICIVREPMCNCVCNYCANAAAGDWLYKSGASGHR